VSAAEVTARQKALALARANAKHDTDSATHGLEQARAALSAARIGSSQIGVTGAQADAAREDLQNARAALRAAIAGTGDVSVRVAQEQEAMASYQQSAAEYQRQRNNSAKMRIFSPIEGIVTSVETKEGETVTAGFQTPTLMTIANLNRIQVEVPVDETDIGRLSVGQKASVTVDAFPNTPFPGRVIKVASDATVENNVVSYKCTVAIDKAGVTLKPRMTATVNIDTGLVKNALVVPLDAVKTAKDSDVVYLPPDPAKKNAPYVEKAVKTGASDDKVYQILSGLKDGQKVVISSSRLEAQRQRQGQGGGM
jgi:RND family efflux transporter MFP subunit